MPQQTAHSWNLCGTNNNDDTPDYEVEFELEFEVSIIFWCVECQMFRAFLLDGEHWVCVGCNGRKDNEKPQEIL